MEFLGSIKLRHVYSADNYLNAPRLPLMQLPDDLCELHQIIRGMYVGKLATNKFVLESHDRTIYVSTVDILNREDSANMGYVAVIRENDLTLTQVDYITGPNSILSTIGLVNINSCGDLKLVRSILEQLGYKIAFLTNGPESTANNSPALSLDDIHESLKNNEGVALPLIQQYIDRGLLDPNLVQAYRDSVVLSKSILNAITLKG